MNNEENHKDNDETVKRNDVKSEKLVTQLQINNGVTLKTSEYKNPANSSRQPQHPQLAVKQTTNTDQTRASNLMLKRVRALFLLVDCA